MSFIHKLAAFLGRAIARGPAPESPDDEPLGDVAVLDRADVAALRAPHTEPI